MSLLTLLAPHFGVLRARAGIGDWRDVGCRTGGPGLLRLQLPDGSWIQEACPNATGPGTLYVGGATGSSVTDTVSLTAPAGIVAGDFLLVTGASWSDASATSIPGYTAAGVNDNTRIFTRTADGTESGSTVTMTNAFGAGPHALILQVFRGPASYTTRGIAHAFAGTTFDSPVVGTGLGTFLLQETWCAVKNGATAGLTLTPPAELSNVLSVSVGPSSGDGPLCLVVGLDTQTVTTGTNTAARTATSSADSSWQSATMSFPAPAVPVAGHPLRIEDPSNPGTWIDVACMVPA